MTDRDRRDAELIKAALYYSWVASIRMREGCIEDALSLMELASRMLGKVGGGPAAPGAR